MTPSTSEQSSRASATATRSQLLLKRRKSQRLSLRKKHQQRKKLLRKSLRRRSQSKRLLRLNLRRKKLLLRLPPRSTPDNIPYVTPLVRKLADKHGIDLNTVEGTGVGGRIRKQDVLAAAEGGAESGSAAPAGERANWSTKSVDPAKQEL